MKVLSNLAVRATIVLCMSALSVGAQRAPANDRIAQGIVKALRDNPGNVHFDVCLDSAYQEKEVVSSAARQALDIAARTTGEAELLRNRMAWLQLFARFCSRRPLGPAKVADYLARFRAISKANVEAWQAAQKLSAEPGNSMSMALAAIAFHDFLFDGGAWKTGNPDRALARLSSLTKGAVDQLNNAVGSEYENGAWALLAVDGLFINDKFQPQVFRSALPTALKLLAEHK